jgi:hypothetical protein
MPDDKAQVAAYLPREVRRRFYSELALREQKFSAWLRSRVEDFLSETERDTPPEVPHAES